MRSPDTDGEYPRTARGGLARLRFADFQRRMPSPANAQFDLRPNELLIPTRLLGSVRFESAIRNRSFCGA